MDKKWVIAIVGSGNVGGALAQRWVEAGHAVLIGAQFPLSAKNIELATKIGEDRFTSVPFAVQQAEVILYAAPPHAAPEVVAEWGDLKGKVLIDATNAMGKSPSPFPTVFHYFLEHTTAELVKCFNTTGFENLLNPQYGKDRLDLFMAGNSVKGKEIAAQLAVDSGFDRCIDFGGNDQVELLEKFAEAWINLAIRQKMGRRIGFKLLMK